MSMGLVHTATAAFFRLINRDLTVGRGVQFDPRAFPARGGRISLGDSTIIRAGAMLVPGGGSIQIGRNTTVNQYVVIYGEGGVSIGDDVMIASHCALFAGNHRYERTDIPMREQGTYSKGGITIDDDVWLGCHCVVLDGVTIGRGSVLAAGTVISRDVAPGSIMAGVPGQCIGNRLEAGDEPEPTGSTE
ncbi:MAG: acyltransferase [Myxococcota bacterium]|nr:acyltransferase [Myxococcota bacterium]